MKKLRILSSSLIVATMLTGAGYAAWTDTLTINNTVETGQLNVQFHEGKFLGLQYPDASADKYVEAKAEISDKDSHTTQIDLNNLYPGAWAAFRVRAINAGTIPAKVANVDVQFSGDKELLPYLTYETRISMNPDDTSSNLTMFTLKGKLEDFKDTINKSIPNIQLAPNSKGSFCIGSPKNISNVTNNSADSYFLIKLDKNTPITLQKKSLSFTIQVNFKQFNQ